MLEIKQACGIYSPLSLYATIAKDYISAFSQGLSSFEEHSADGKWDMGILRQPESSLVWRVCIR